MPTNSPVSTTPITHKKSWKEDRQTFCQPEKSSNFSKFTIVHFCLLQSQLVLEAFLFLGFLVRCLVDRLTTFQRVSQRPLNGILVAFYAQLFLGWPNSLLVPREALREISVLPWRTLHYDSGQFLKSIWTDLIGIQDANHWVTGGDTHTSFNNKLLISVLQWSW